MPADNARPVARKSRPAGLPTTSYVHGTWAASQGNNNKKIRTRRRSCCSRAAECRTRPGTGTRALAPWCWLGNCVDSLFGWEIQARWRKAGIYGLLGEPAAPSCTRSTTQSGQTPRAPGCSRRWTAGNFVQRHGTEYRGMHRPERALHPEGGGGGLLAFSVARLRVTVWRLASRGYYSCPVPSMYSAFGFLIDFFRDCWTCRVLRLLDARAGRHDAHRLVNRRRRSALHVGTSRTGPSRYTA